MILTMLLLGQAMAAVPTPAVAAPAKTAAKDKIVCVSEPVVGSRLAGHRICRTAAEWERDRREGQDDVERAQRLAKLPGQ